MGVVQKINGVDRLAKTLARKAAGYAAQKDIRIVVGYTAAYAIVQHENMELNHPNGGQAKYLEEPARRMKKVFAKIVTDVVTKGRTVADALLLVGLRLQRESQLLVPVDTGALKASAFTKKETA